MSRLDKKQNAKLCTFSIISLLLSAIGFIILFLITRAIISYHVFDFGPQWLAWFWFSLYGPFFAFSPLLILMIILAITFAILGLVKISRYPNLRGKILSILCIIFNCIMIVFYLIILKGYAAGMARG